MQGVPTQAIAFLLADARLPVGGHAHSGGMEPALLGGLGEDQLRDFLLGRARTTSIIEAGTAVATLVAWQESRDSTAPAGWPALDRITAAWAARTPSAAQRDAARLLGRGYLRLAQRWWPGESSALSARHPRSVVLGVIAGAAGLSPVELARLSIYDDAQTAASALLKLQPMDPLQPARWVLDACAAAEELLPAAIAATTPEAIPAFGAPQAEGWAEAHALLTQRLFRA